MLKLALITDCLSGWITMLKNNTMTFLKIFTYRRIHIRLDFIPETNRIYTVKVHLKSLRGKRQTPHEKTINQAVFVYAHLDLFINRLQKRYNLHSISAIDIFKIRQNGLIISDP